MATKTQGRRIEYGSLGIAAGGVGVGGYLLGSSLDTGRTSPPTSAVASFAVLVPLGVGALAAFLLWKRNRSAAYGAAGGGALGALWGLVEFPKTPAGIAAEVSNVINTTRATIAAAQAQRAAAGTPEGAGGATPAAMFNGATASTQAGYIGRSVTPFNRFSPGHTPRLSGAIRIAGMRARRRRMGSIIPNNLRNGGSAFPTDAWSN